jgi:two-component system CheB/CheR fusion protein
VVLPRLHYALNPEGFLFLGKAETQLARSPLFKPVEMKHRIFAKVAQEWRRPIGGGFGSGRVRRADAPLPSVMLLEAALNERAAALLVIDEAGAVALANTPARQLLGVGEADHRAPVPGPADLVSADGIARADRGSVPQPPRHKAGGSGISAEPDRARPPDHRCAPAARPDGSVYAVLLCFADTTRMHTLQLELETAQENLENSIEELQSANEELETTNEELQSTNEELETTNEELQSTNEELETLNEEARSSNEEMESVNEELRIQAEQASELSHPSGIGPARMNGGIIVIDQKHAIQSWNRWSENSWGLRAEEVIGTSFEALDIGLPVHLLRDAMTAVQMGREEQIEQMIEGMDRRGRRILCRVIVSGLRDEDGTGHGLVLVFQDLTDERRRDEYGQYLGRVMGKALNEIYFLDPTTLHFTLANEGAQKKLGHSDQQLMLMTLLDVIPDVDAAQLRTMIAPLINGDKPEIVFETVIQPAESDAYPAEICMQYFASEHPPILVAIVHDTSERQQLQPES